MTININKFQQKINNKYPHENIQVIYYHGIKSDSQIKCLTCGTIYTYKRSDSILHKDHCCPKCYNYKNKKKNFNNILHKKFPNDKLEVIDFVDRKQPCIVKCLRCGTTKYYKRANYALESTLSTYCRTCEPGKKIARKNTIDKFKDFIEHSDKWELAQDVNDLKTTQDLIQCKCKLCGKINRKSINDYLRGRGCMCESHPEQKTLQDIQKCIGDDYAILSKYQTIYDKLKIRHESCGFIYTTVARNIYRGNGRCPRCSKKESKGEKRIQLFLDSNNIKYVREYKICIQNHNLRFDFYLPDKNIFIEFNGIQHYKPIQYFGGEERFKKQRAYDTLKRDFAGNKLIVISYDSIDDVEKILTDTLLSSTTTQ